MAGFISRYWESIKIKFFRLWDVGEVVHAMKTGECYDQWALAMVICDRDALRRTAFEREHGEVLHPLDLDACIKATETLRQCMQRKPDFFREHIAAMDAGIENEKRQRREEQERRRREAEDDPRFRWWSGLRNS
ncbi:unnamed protein product [Alopecurus aequalis]